MSQNPPRVSVIIPSLYEVDHEYLKLCVESLRATTDWDIIVVTNGGGVKPILPFICTHIHTKQQGQCNAVNIGAQVAAGDYLMVSNSDMYYAPGWNKNLRFDYPIFSPNLVEPTNNLGSAPPFLKFGGGLTIDEFNRQAVDKNIDRNTHDLADASQDLTQEPGFNLPFFIKRDFFNFLGGYDVAYDPWGSNSDTDLQTRINLAGVTPMRLRDVLVYHFSNKTPTFSPENDAFRMYNFEYFRDKFGFDRDELGSDVWYNKDMIPEDKDRIKYDQPRFL
jgi:glycosyltransferase involved in cell wall biosynthesis